MMFLCLCVKSILDIPPQICYNNNMAYVITEACMDVMDKSCIQECPVDCIKVGKNMLYIDPNDCVDCGACVPVCPTDAIYYEDDLPENLKHYKDINKDFFA